MLERLTRRSKAHGCFQDPSTVAYLKAKSQIAARKIMKAVGSSADPNVLIPLSAKRSAVPRPVRLPVLSRLIENVLAKSIISKVCHG